MTGEVIKALRIRRGLSQDALAKLCGYEDRSSIAKIETGKVDLPESKIKLFSKVFEVTPASLMGLEPLPQADIPLLQRAIDPIYDALNPAGQKELCRYGRYLTTQDDFRREESEPQIEYIRHYLTAAAAGYAAPVEGSDYELIPRPAEAPSAADYCINIDGDSMEPYIKDGSLVYVQRGADLAPFDPGVFFVDGDVYCKQWCPSYDGSLLLLSANPARQDANLILPRDSGRNVQYFGKVLLKKKLPRPDYL